MGAHFLASMAFGPQVALQLGQPCKVSAEWPGMIRGYFAAEIFQEFFPDDVSNGQHPSIAGVTSNTLIFELPFGIGEVPFVLVESFEIDKMATGFLANFTHDLIFGGFAQKQLRTTNGDGRGGSSVFIRLVKALR